MRNQAIKAALTCSNPGVESFAFGNIVVGQDFDHVAIAFNQTEGCQNQVVALNVRDAKLLFKALQTAGKHNGWVL